MSLNSRTAISHCVLACLFAASMTHSHAENVTSYQSALQKVQAYQSENELGQQREQLAELNQKQSRLWQNPSLNIEQSGFESGQEKELSIGISQPLDIFGQRKLDRRRAETSSQQMQLQQQLWNAQSQLIVKFAWSQLMIAELEQRIYAAQMKVSQANLESAEKRYRVGSIALVDFERAQIESLEIKRLQQQALLKLHAAKRQLSNLWGESNSQVSTQTDVIAWPDQSEQTVQNYITQGWLEKLYALNLKQANYQIDNLKIKGRSQPTLNVGMTSTQTPEEKDDTALVVGVELPLNLFNRQQYTIPMAQKQQLLINQQQQRELQQQILDIANQLQQLKGLKNQNEAVSTQIKLAENVQKRTLQGFQAGKFSLTDIQQSTMQLQNLRLAQLELLSRAWQTALSAEALSIGTTFEDISRSDAYSQLHKKATEATQDLMNWGN